MMELTHENVVAVCQRYAAMQHPTEVFYLLRFLKARNVKQVVELGVHRGGMAAALKTFLGAQVIGVEILPLGRPHPAMESVPLPADAPTLAQTARELGIPIVEGSSYNSASLDKALALAGLPREGKVFDFVFIDASHDYHSVQRDYELWSPHARIIGFHDLHSDDILRYWREITPRRTISVWKEYDGLGIGVIGC